MDKKICLDTNVCIELIKGNLTLKSKLYSYLAMPAYISPITVFELFLRKSNLYIIEEFVKNFEIMPIDEHKAKKGSRLFNEAKQMGRPVDLRDVLIAATCIINNLELVTLNKKDFLYIKELKLLNI